MVSESTRRILAGGGVSVLGTVVTVVTLFDVYEDLAVQGVPVTLTLFENALPLVLNLSLVAAGLLVVADESLRAEFVTRTTKWTILGGFSLLSMIGWVYYFQARQGQIKPAILFSHVVSMGAVAGLAVGVYDGQRREREAQLAGERDKILALFENSSDCIAEVEFVEGRPIVREVNPAFLEVFGFERSEIVGSSLDETIIPDSERDGASDLTDRANRGEQFEIEEVIRRTADGDLRVAKLQVVPFSASESTGDIYAVYTDITAEHRYEQRITALHESTRNLVTIGSVEGIAEATVTAVEEVLDLHYTSVHLYDSGTDRLSPAAYTDDVEELLGTPPAFGPGEAIAWDVFRAETARYVEDVRADPDAYNDDSPLGSELVVPLQGFGVLLIGAEEPNAFDETDFSLAKILAANVEVAMERAEREAELERQNEQLETFTSIVSHDLRNPLSVASGYLELAREGDEAAFDRVETALERMDELIANLLTLARQGEAIDEVVPVTVGSIAERAWNNTETADATLAVEADGELEADPARLQQLLENLFTNAVEHAGDDVTVRVSATDAGFVVEDDGPGISESERDDVLAQGYTTREGGTGFGLAIVDKIASGHGWSIRIEEGDDGGAKFVFEAQ
ncbi:PAS domain-containing sensor histidine kinase [Halobellus rufus]|uniref:PAS domain-containing sensor histidine kinase n=1 Tax=Halobellus rufus TaxID=1448860 RepID=UPI0006784ABE|nr:ATP-binding protein [Halobellus rufus]